MIDLIFRGRIKISVLRGIFMRKASLGGSSLFEQGAMALVFSWMTVMSGIFALAGKE